MKRYLPLLSLGLKSLPAAILLFTASSVSLAQEKETLENKVPKHLPIKVEISYGKGAQILENAEIRVTNTGKRPIYYVDFIAGTGQNSQLDKNYAVSWLRFGRLELRTLKNLANDDDPSLKPGETYIFRLGNKAVEDFRKGLRGEQQIVPNRYELIFQVLSFGDGTGFSSTGGLPYPEEKVRPFVNATDRRVPFFFGTRF